MRIAVLLMLLAMAAGSPALAQNRRLIGSITDSHGAVLAGATVRIASAVTGGSVQTVFSDDEGNYSVNLTPGSYAVRVELGGFASVESTVTILAGRDRFFDATLQPASATEDVIVASIGDSASGRPGYLPQSGIAQGGLFTAYGKFPVREGVVTNQSPFPNTLNGLSLTVTDRRGTILSTPIYYASPTQVTAVMPSSAAPGTYFLTANVGGRASREARFQVIAERPTFFTLNQTGSGPGILTDPNFNVITYQNPARPNGFYTAWIANFGGVQQDAFPTIEDKRSSYNDFSFRIGNTVLPKEDIQFLGSSGAAFGQLNFQIRPEVVNSQGCAIPVQLGVQSKAGDPFQWSNQVTIPISSSGACSDALGFAASDFPQLTTGLNVAEATISEASFFDSSRARRDLISGRLSAFRFTDKTYNPPAPPNSWAYRWEPPGFLNPFAAERLTLGGAASLTVPWGVFNFSSTSNAGPFSLSFSFPAAFREGAYSLNYSDTFTVRNERFTFQATGSYQRPAGRMREYFISRATPTFLNPDKALLPLIEDILRASSEAPADLRQSLYGDLIITVDDTTRGTHLARCIFDPNANTRFLDQLNNGILPLIPERPNRTRVDFRFFPKSRITHNHAGVLNRSNVTFDSFLSFDDLLGVR